MTEMYKSIAKYTFSKKIFVALIFVIVLFSSVFTAYTFRLGLAFGYDSVMTDEGLYVYRFYGKNGNIVKEDVFADYFSKYDFVSSEYFYDDYYNEISAGDYFKEYSVRRISSADDLKLYPGAEKYITAEDIEKENKLMIVSSLDVSFSENQIDIGKTVLLNGVEYLVAGVEDIINSDGISCTPLVVDCEELRATYDRIIYSVYTEKEISNSNLKKIAASAGISARLPEKEKYIFGFLVLSITVCVLFTVNIAILFNAFVKAGDKFYAIFKILGISTAKLVLAMSLPSLMIAFVAALTGIGVDYAIASNSTVLEKSVYLTAGGAVAIVAINTLGAFIGTAVSCYRQAKNMPAVSLRRAE